MSSEAWYVRDRNKVSGPFNREQLDALRRRGQLARFHQVSQDRQTWAPASTLTDLFAAPSAPSTTGPIPAPGPAAPGPAEHWYYQDGQAASGPVSAQALLGLFATGKVGPDTLVWKEGAPDWVALRDAGLRPAMPGPASMSPVPARPSNSASAPTRKRRSEGDVWIAVGLGAGVGGVVLILGFLLLYRAGGFSFGAGAKGAPPASPGLRARPPSHRFTTPPKFPARKGS